MTEAEWLACKDPRAMIWGLRNLRNKRSRRKLRLFAVACCHRIRHLLEEQPDAVRAVDLAEQYADGQVSEAEMLAVSMLVSDIHSGVWDAYIAARKASSKNPTYTFRDQYWDGADYQAACAVWRSTLWEQIKTEPDPPRQERPNATALTAKAIERGTQADILRCIFGNPFRPAGLGPLWRTTDIVRLATAIYDENVSDQLPILADALEEAGCDVADVLAHCRGSGPHVRRCWVVDLILVGRQF
jgi:hypothetical protein